MRVEKGKILAVTVDDSPFAGEEDKEKTFFITTGLYPGSGRVHDRGRQAPRPRRPSPTTARTAPSPP